MVDKVGPIRTEGVWATWYLCHWKVKVCLGIKCSLRDCKIGMRKWLEGGRNCLV